LLASDLCVKVLGNECLTFPKYMTIATRIAERAVENKSRSQYLSNGMFHDTVILTSESRSVLNAKIDFEKRKTFPYKFIVNDFAGGTGRPRPFQSIDILNITAYDIMLSTTIALKMQLLTQSTVGNCCSHFHLIIQSLLTRGCRSAKLNKFQCVQKNKDSDCNNLQFVYKID